MLEEAFVGADRYMVRNFSLHAPDIYEATKRIEMFGPFRLIAFTADGSIYVYDNLNGGTRRLFNSSAEYAKRGYFTDEEWMYRFAAMVQYRMDDRFMTQDELSEMTGISQSALSHYMNCRRVPSIINVYKIAKALKCSIDDIAQFDYMFDWLEETEEGV